ncbi:polypyrimidine tract-binding protein homolog 3 isoform X1 [Tanacetum coccineum]
MTSGGSDRDAEDALSKLLQMGMVAEYQNEFEMLRNQVQDPKQTTQGRGDERNRILLVTIHRMLYPITMEVLHQVFSPHGYVDKVAIFQKSAGFQALIQFQSRKYAIATRNSLLGNDIYEGSCQLDIWFSNFEEVLKSGQYNELEWSDMVYRGYAVSSLMDTAYSQSE